MLEEKDLQALQTLIDQSIIASENRMKAYMDQGIQASETRMKTYMDQGIRDSENRMMAYFESAVMPKFDLLAEGQQTLLDTLAPRNRVEALENDVSLLKQVVRSMSQEIAELKKAQ